MVKVKILTFRCQVRMKWIVRKMVKRPLTKVLSSHLVKVKRKPMKTPKVKVRGLIWKSMVSKLQRLWNQKTLTKNKWVQKVVDMVVFKICTENTLTKNQFLLLTPTFVREKKNCQMVCSKVTFTTQLFLPETFVTISFPIKIC